MSLKLTTLSGTHDKPVLSLGRKLHNVQLNDDDKDDNSRRLADRRGLRLPSTLKVNSSSYTDDSKTDQLLKPMGPALFGSAAGFDGKPVLKLRK